jgi:UMP-CMP kinase
VPKEVTIGLLRDAMSASPEARGFLIDGFPRAMDQCVMFEEMVAPCEFCLFFDCPEAELERRLLERGKTSGRTDDNAESILKRFRTYVEQTRPVIDHFDKGGRVRRIEAARSVEEVSKDVLALF